MSRKGIADNHGNTFNAARQVQCFWCVWWLCDTPWEARAGAVRGACARVRFAFGAWLVSAYPLLPDGGGRSRRGRSAGWDPPPTPHRLCLPIRQRDDSDAAAH